MLVLAARKFRCRAYDKPLRPPASKSNKDHPLYKFKGMAFKPPGCITQEEMKKLIPPGVCIVIADSRADRAAPFAFGYGVSFGAVNWVGFR